MHRKTLASGILLLFLISTVSPLSMGVSLQEQTTVPLVQSSGPMDSPWPMHSYDRKHTGLSPYNTSHNPGIELWRFECHGFESSPIIGDDGTIYAQGGYGDDPDYINAVNPDGSLKWRFKASDIMDFCTPAIADDGTIYVCCWDSKIYAININGTLKWKTPLGGIGDGGVTIADDGMLYIGVGSSGYIKAIYPNGTIKWSYSTDDSVFAPPAIADDGIIYCGSFDHYFYALYPNGTLYWKYKTGDHIKGPASIANDGTIYVGSFDDYLYAFFPNGTIRWKTKIGRGSETNPSIGPDGTIYIGGDEFYAINPDGTMKWTIDLGGLHWITGSSPAISADGIIYVATTIGTGGGGDIIAINPNGTVRWRNKISTNWVRSSPVIGEDGTIYVGSRYEISRGYLHAFGDGTSSGPPDGVQIKGPKKLLPVFPHRFYLYAEDPDHNPLTYYVDWGDGTIDEWTLYGGSHEQFVVMHAFPFFGTYNIKAKARDNFGEESDWAYYRVWVPYTYQYPGWQWLMERFPLVSRLLNLLGGIP